MKGDGDDERESKTPTIEATPKGTETAHEEDLTESSGVLVGTIRADPVSYR
jgi:hypothetical protein